jgi:hypothetical protein
LSKAEQKRLDNVSRLSQKNKAAEMAALAIEVDNIKHKLNITQNEIRIVTN